MGIKFIHRVPTVQFGYIEFEEEHDNPQEAIAANAEYASMLDNPGLSEKEWAQARNQMLATGEFDPNLELSKAQAWWVNQTKLALRAHK